MSARSEIQLSQHCNPVERLKSAIKGAQNTIDASVYKFESAEVFEALKKALHEKKKLKVRLIVNNWQVYRKGNPKKPKKTSLSRDIVSKRVTVKVWCKDKLHAKFVIIDGKLVLTGSYNWTKRADYCNKPKKRNTELLLEFNGSILVDKFKLLFEDMWKETKAYHP